MLLVRIDYSVLCACALSIPHPITFGQKIDRVKYMKIVCLNVCGLRGTEVDYKARLSTLCVFII